MTETLLYVDLPLGTICGHNTAEARVHVQLLKVNTVVPDSIMWVWLDCVIAKQQPHDNYLNVTFISGYS